MERPEGIPGSAELSQLYADMEMARNDYQVAQQEFKEIIELINNISRASTADDRLSLQRAQFAAERHKQAYERYMEKLTAFNDLTLKADAAVHRLLRSTNS